MNLLALNFRVALSASSCALAAIASAQEDADDRAVAQYVTFEDNFNIY